MTTENQLDGHDWLTPKEAATWLRISVKVVYRLAAEDPTFPCIKLTNLLRIRRSRLERWLDHRHPAAPKRLLKPLPGSNNPEEPKVESEAPL